MTIGDLIREYRESHNLSQRDFAKKSGLSNGYISMLEKGEDPRTGKPVQPKIDSLFSIARTMHMSLQDLAEKVDDDIPVSLVSVPLKNPADDDGISELISVFSELSEDNRSKLIELAHLYLDAQSNK